MPSLDSYKDAGYADADLALPEPEHLDRLKHAAARPGAALQRELDDVILSGLRLRGGPLPLQALAVLLQQDGVNLRLLGAVRAGVLAVRTGAVARAATHSARLLLLEMVARRLKQRLRVRTATVM